MQMWLYPNLLYLIFPNIREKYHLHLRMTNRLWRDMSKRFIQPERKHQSKDRWRNIFFDEKLLHIRQGMYDLRYLHIADLTKYINDKFLLRSMLEDHGRMGYGILNWDKGIDWGEQHERPEIKNLILRRIGRIFHLNDNTAVVVFTKNYKMAYEILGKN